MAERVYSRGPTEVSSAPPSTDSTPLTVPPRCDSGRPPTTFWNTPGWWVVGTVCEESFSFYSHNSSLEGTTDIT